jgi:hypothetical protein
MTQKVEKILRGSFRSDKVNLIRRRVNGNGRRFPLAKSIAINLMEERESHDQSGPGIKEHGI